MAEFTNVELSSNEKFVEEHTVAQAMVEKPKIFRVKDSDSLLKAFQYAWILILTHLGELDSTPNPIC
jgi:hypothetical protein